MSQKNGPGQERNEMTEKVFQKNPIVPQGGMGRGFQGRGPVVKPKDFKGTLRRMWEYTAHEAKWLWIIFIVILGSAALTLAGPYLIGRAIDTMGLSQNIASLRLFEWIVLLLLVAYITDAVLLFVQGWLMAGVSQRMVKRMRQALFGKLQKLPISYFDTRSHGEVMSRLTNDIDNVSVVVSQSTTQLMSGVITIVGSLVMMLILSPVLTLASLITVPLVYGLTRTITKQTRSLFKEQQQQLGKLNGHIEETISGIQVVKAFNHEDQSIEDFERVNDRLVEVGLKAQIRSGFLMPIMNVINNLGFVAVAVVGGALAVNEWITVGVIASFLSYSRQFGRPLNDIANIYNLLQSGVAGAERVFEVLDESEEVADVSEATELSDTKGHVVFSNVSFGYRPDVPILKNISFEAPAGSSTALIGPTGAGKTTIVNLLTRFYDVTGGTIYIDGQDIRKYTRSSLRNSFGMVLQDTYLFHGTIKENIKYGKPDATDDEVRAAAAMANADPFISRLPKQYDTLLSENGGNLSQGERQLLSIARVMLAQPAILILDEATSNVDTRTELHIQDALLKVMEGRTSFIIAHRLNTIRDADTVMVIDGGQIQEQTGRTDLQR